ncbi:MAG TPA: hypothetical protein VFO51_02145 [Sphingomicrobium sp.]|nr:hypothetical protein [Sphingomicrobium sp.]
MEPVTRKPRRIETTEERRNRLSRDAQAKIDDSAAADKAVDAMIRRSIDLYGA